MVLTVEDILNGIEEYKEVHIEALGDTMYLRPLSKGEWEKTNSIRQESLGDYVTNEKAKAVNQWLYKIKMRKCHNLKPKLKNNIMK